MTAQGEEIGPDVPRIRVIPGNFDVMRESLDAISSGHYLSPFETKPEIRERFLSVLQAYVDKPIATVWARLLRED